MGEDWPGPRLRSKGRVPEDDDGGDPKATYTPMPPVPEALRGRYEGAVMGVLSGATTVSEAARRLDLSRNHFPDP